jgi:hypothetical protein
MKRKKIKRKSTLWTDRKKTQSKKTKMDKTGNGNGLDAMTLKKTFSGIYLDRFMSMSLFT